MQFPDLSRLLQRRVSVPLIGIASILDERERGEFDMLRASSDTRDIESAV